MTPLDFLDSLIENRRRSSTKSQTAAAFSSMLRALARVGLWRPSDWGDIMRAYGSLKTQGSLFGSHAPLGESSTEDIYSCMCEAGNTGAARSFELHAQRPRYPAPVGAIVDGIPCLRVGLAWWSHEHRCGLVVTSMTAHRAIACSDGDEPGRRNGPKRRIRMLPPGPMDEGGP
jgi:hypothetical protein